MAARAPGNAGPGGDGHAPGLQPPPPLILWMPSGTQSLDAPGGSKNFEATAWDGHMPTTSAKVLVAVFAANAADDLEERDYWEQVWLLSHTAHPGITLHVENALLVPPKYTDLNEGVLAPRCAMGDLLVLTVHIPRFEVAHVAAEMAPASPAGGSMGAGGAGGAGADPGSGGGYGGGGGAAAATLGSGGGAAGGACVKGG